MREGSERHWHTLGGCGKAEFSNPRRFVHGTCVPVEDGGDFIWKLGIAICCEFSLFVCLLGGGFLGKRLQKGQGRGVNVNGGQQSLRVTSGFQKQHPCVSGCHRDHVRAAQKGGANFLALSWVGEVGIQSRDCVRRMGI